MSGKIRLLLLNGCQVFKTSLMMPRVNYLRVNLPITQSCVVSNLFSTTSQSLGSKKAAGKKGKKGNEKQSANDPDHDEDDDDDYEKTRKLRMAKVAAAKFVDDVAKGKISGLKAHKSSGRDKNKSHHAVHMRFEEVSSLMDIVGFWHELSCLLDSQKHFYVHNLSVRSMNVLDELPIELEKEKFPLRELAQISKRDAKQLVIDCSSFPQAAQSIMKTIRESALNLNPQQDGLRIYVPVAKVSKEQREKLAKGAKVRMSETKQEMQKIQSRTMTKLDDLEKNAVSNDLVFALKNLVSLVTDHFVKEASNMMETKQKELLDH